MSEKSEKKRRVRHIQFKTFADCPLENWEVQKLIEEGGPLFALLEFTPEAEEYLRYRKELLKIVEKW